MRLRGACRCQNLQITWHVVDFSLVPRACQCRFCTARGAAWLSKSGSALALSVTMPDHYRRLQQGAELATFHECGFCGQVVCVTVAVEGEVYGALNAVCLDQAQRFPDRAPKDFSGQSPEEKLRRWQANWCHPVKLPAMGD